MAKPIKPFDGLAYNYDLEELLPRIGNGSTYPTSYPQGLYGLPSLPSGAINLPSGPGPSVLASMPSVPSMQPSLISEGVNPAMSMLAPNSDVGVELTPEERFQRALAAISKPQFQKYTGYDSIPIPDPGKAPVYDREAERSAAIHAARIAAVTQALGAISGAGIGGTSLAARLGANFFSGAQQGLANDFKGEQANYANLVDSLDKRYASQIRGLQGQNQAVDQANDNSRSVYNNEVNNASRQYGIDVANDKANKDRDLKAKEAERKADEAKIKTGLALAVKGLLNESGEEEISKLLNKHMGTGFSPDFMLTMTAEQRAKLDEVALTREQKATLQTQRLKAQKDIKDADRKAVSERQESRNTLLDKLNQRTNQTRSKIAALRNSKSPTAAKTGAELRGQLQFLTGLSTRVSRANTEAQRYERMAQDLLKNTERQDAKGEHGLNPAGEAEYARLRAQAEEAHAVAQRLDEYYQVITDKTTSGLGLPPMPGDSAAEAAQSFIEGGGFFGGDGLPTAPVVIDEEANRRMQAYAREQGTKGAKTPLKKGAKVGGFTIEEIR